MSVIRPFEKQAVQPSDTTDPLSITRVPTPSADPQDTQLETALGSLPHVVPSKQPNTADNSEVTAVGEPILDQIHSFSRTVAKQYGWKAALVLQYLAVRVAKSKHFFDGKPWHYETIKSLAERYPYIHRATIHNILAELTKPGGPLLKGNKNKHAYDRTCWYAFNDESIRRSVFLKPLYFSKQDAIKFGVVEAVLLMNIAHWVKKNRKEKPGYTWHRLSGEGMTKHWPFSKSAINRALDHLFEEGELDKHPVGGFCKEYEYRTADETRLSDPNLDIDDPELDMDGPNLDMQDPGLDNDTYLKDTVNRHPLKRHSYKERPASPTAGGGSVLSEVNESSIESDSISSNSQPPCQVSATPVAGRGATDSFKDSSTTLTNTASSSSSEFQALLDRAKPLCQKVTPQKMRKRLQDVAYLTVKDVINSTDEDVLWQIVQLSSKDELLKAVSPLLDNRKDRTWVINFAGVHGDIAEDMAKYFFVTACEVCKSRGEAFSPVSCLVEELNRKFQPRVEAEEKECKQRLFDRLWKLQQERAKKHRSLDQAKERDTTISAAEKVKVLKNSLIARNRAGWPSKDGKLVSQVVDYNNGSMKAAYRFFQANPDVSVEHLNTVLDCCVETKFQYPVEEGADDPSFSVRRGTNLSFFFCYLDKIITQLEYLELPAITYLSKEALGLDRKPKEEALKANNAAAS